MNQLNTNAIDQLAARYIAVWHETDADLRRKGIAELWTEDGTYTNELAELQGYAALEAAVIRAHEEFVKKGYIFKAAKVVGHHNVVRLYWEMLPAGGSTVESNGFDFFILADDGRIRHDYQFTDKQPSFS
jgi:hypothetical protein